MQISRIPALAIAMTAMSAVAAGAQDVGAAPGPQSRLSTGDGRIELNYFADAACVPDCSVVRLICGEYRQVEISLFGITRDQLIGWMATGSPPDNIPGFLRLRFDTDGATESFQVYNLIVADDGETWIAANTYLSFGRMADWMAAFATANDVTVRTPFTTVTLASRPEDQANRAAFVDACEAM